MQKTFTLMVKDLFKQNGSINKALGNRILCIIRKRFAVLRIKFMIIAIFMFTCFEIAFQNNKSDNFSSLF